MIRNDLLVLRYILNIFIIFQNSYANYIDIDVPSDYNINFPKLEPGNPFNLSISTQIYENFKVDLRESIIIVDAVIIHRWVDEQILINEMPSETGSVISPKKVSSIWAPLLYIEGVKERKDHSYTFGKAEWILLYPDLTLERYKRDLLTIYCELTFTMFPLDVQHCKIEFSEPDFIIDQIKLVWYKEPSFVGESDYVFKKYSYIQGYLVDIETCPDPIENFTPIGKTWALRYYLNIHNSFAEQCLQIYIPSILLVMICWGSFLVRPLIVPGRASILLSSLLCMVTLFVTQRLNYPGKGIIKALDVWEIVCLLFTTLAIFEYFVILFQIRNPSTERRIIPTVQSQPFYSEMKTCLFKIKNLVIVDPSHPDGWNNLDRFCIKWYPITFFTFIFVYWFVCVLWYILSEILYKKNMCTFI